MKSKFDWRSEAIVGMALPILSFQFSITTKCPQKSSICGKKILNAYNEVEHVTHMEKQPPNNTKEGAYLLIMGLHMCMCNINLDFLLLKLSEQNNHMRECVLTMEYLCKII
jgi:hypothetical protein